MELLIAAVGLLLLALFGLVAVWVLWRLSRSAASRLLANAEKEAKRIVARAEIDGQRIHKDVEVLARERLLAARTEFERESRELRLELTGLETRLAEQGVELEARSAALVDRERTIETMEADLA
ncbi:MAG: Rnase Y domain-containing protein, partial [Acidobacteriota bacterium]